MNGEFDKNQNIRDNVNSDGLHGRKKDEVWSGLYLSANHASQILCGSFMLYTNEYGSVILTGSCFNKSGDRIENKEGFALHGDILRELRELNLDELGDRNNSSESSGLPSPNETVCFLSLKYSDGQYYKKSVPSELFNQIFILLRNELCRWDALEKKRLKEFAAKEYRIFSSIRENDLNRVEALISAEPSLVNAIAPKRPSDTKGMSPLQVSLCTGWHKEIAAFLLKSGADVNYRAERKWTSESHPVLFDCVNTALWNSRRYTWDGKPVPPLNLIWRHTKEESDTAFNLLKCMIDMGADVNQTDYYGRNALFEAVSTANSLCPQKEENGIFYPPGRPMTPEMSEDFRRIIKLLIDSGADKNSTSTFLKKNIREYFSTEYIWNVCGDLFNDEN